MNYGFEDIKKKYQSEVIVTLVNDLEKREDVKDLQTLKNMLTLAHWLYALGEKEYTIYFADIVSAMDLKLYKRVKEFSDSAACAHSYQIKALALCTVACKETGDFKRAESYWSRYLVSRLETDKWGEPDDGMVARKRWKRNLEKGDLLDTYTFSRDSYIKRSLTSTPVKKKGLVSSAVKDTFTLLDELLWMREAGGSELYPVERLTQLINEYTTYLQENIDQVKSKDFLK